MNAELIPFKTPKSAAEGEKEWQYGESEELFSWHSQNLLFF